MTPADSVRRLEMQNFGFTTVLSQFWMSLAAESCRSRAESVRLLNPIYNGERVERVPTL